MSEYKGSVLNPWASGGKSVQVSTMPAASAAELGKIVQFVGTTTTDYTKGYFYECVTNGAATPVYSWSRKNVQPSGGSGGSTDFDELENRPSYNGAVMSHSTNIPEVKTSSWDGKYEKPASGIPASDLAAGVIPSVPTTLAELSDDATHRLVTDTEKADWDGKGTYSKPSGGIPSSDMSSAVQESLEKANSALQSHQSLAAYRQSSEQDVIDAGKAGKVARESLSVASGATAVSVPLSPDKVMIVDLTGAGSAVTVTFSASKTGWDLTKENELRAKVLVPASGVAVTFAWDSVTSAGTLSWGGGTAPSFTAGKTTEVDIDLSIGNTNFEGVFVEF